MKRFLYGAMFLCSVLVFSGCGEDETANISKITYFPEFEMNGESQLFVEVGQVYNEPGVKATEQGEEIPVITSVTGKFFGYKGNSLSTESPDLFTISYVAKNVDGFSGSVSREVYVYKNGDLVNSIEGLYVATAKRVPGSTLSNLKYVIIKKTANANEFAISDAVGGYFDINFGYGINYAATGCLIKAIDIPNNSFTYTNAYIKGWGYDVPVWNMNVDAGTKTITFNSSYDPGGGTPIRNFTITLKQVQF